MNGYRFSAYVISIFVEDGLGDDEPPPQYDELSFTTLVM